MSVKEATKTTYFGYGSNLWLDQMQRRCPNSTYVGVARLKDFRWQINSRGYANVAHSNESEVYGLAYTLTPEDEAKLDINEGVPFAYVKEDMMVDFWTSNGKKPVDVGQKPTSSIKMLVYINHKDIADAPPKEEYIFRMNKGIHDAIEMGVPQAYIKRSLRPFIPEKHNKSIETFAQKQADLFIDEN